MFAQIFKLKVIMPSMPVDFKGMIYDEIKDPNPVIILEQDLVHNIKGSFPKSFTKYK